MKIIGEDFQGWPIYALTLKEILKNLGFEENDNTIYLTKTEETTKLLNAYPMTLNDDGMAYGINPRFFIEIDKVIYQVEDPDLENTSMFNESVFNAFIDKPAKNLGKVDENI